MSGCSSTECGIFCILIVDLIFKSALVLFNLYLQASITSKNCPIIVEFIKQKNNTQRIIAYCLSTIKIARVSDQYDFYFHFCNMEQKRYIICYCPLTYDDNLILDMLFIEILCIIFFLEISNQ